MGYFVYDSSREIEVEDRALAHLQVVIIDKLRRSESFAVNLRDGKSVVSIWISPRSAVQFVYSGNRRSTLNRGWLERLSDGVGMTGTLNLVPEPAEDWAPLPAPERERVDVGA
ncbi:DUF7882 family protein [Agromyces humi]|jgi:hypothetical protein|uniref:DUF7882 family protein n=1 Tax=Agromyces humi TaxID=1766800 RepID=UPI00135B15DB|nr:ATP-dependent DNA ligase [Agromyces humi]